MDTFTKKNRSLLMQKVRSKKNKSTELLLIRLFRKYRIKGWKRNSALFGKPDFIFPKLKAAVFVDGCFWHGCFCRTHIPFSNVEYWDLKFKRNIKRDKLVNSTLRKKGWKVIRIKECRLKKGPIKAIFGTFWTKLRLRSKM
jgi:DNA mismatch endonuclease, patch repair protein